MDQFQSFPSNHDILSHFRLFHPISFRLVLHVLRDRRHHQLQLYGFHCNTFFATDLTFTDTIITCFVAGSMKKMLPWKILRMSMDYNDSAAI